MTTTSTLGFCDAIEIARRIRERELSAVECLEYFLGRVKRFNGTLNAAVVLDESRARERAREADTMMSSGESWGPLHGVPMMIKESFDIEGLPTTCGYPALADSVAATDSAVTTRFKAAGAVLFGKTNVPLDLNDFQTYNEIYGTTNNPWDPTRTPGGSSGGESAAIAAGLSSLGCGSDIGGSIRNPAHYAGVYGHKPTYGIVPHDGHGLPAAAPLDLAVYGPLARSAGDLRLALEAIAGPGPLEARGWKLALPDGGKPLTDLRVVVWADDTMAPVDHEIADRCRLVGEALARRGANICHKARPALALERAHACYIKLLMSARLLRQPEDTFDGLKRAAATHAPSDRGAKARAAWNAVMPHRTWLELNEQRTQMRTLWNAFFQDWDIVICPPALSTAFVHDHRPNHERSMTVNGEPAPYFGQLFWAGLALASYLPSTIIPTGPSSDGLPIGVQLMGGEYNDLLTIDVARKLEQLGFAFEPPPGYED